MKGYFLVYENKDEPFDIRCDLRPDIEEDIPEIVGRLYSEVESTCNSIKTLQNTSQEIKRKYFNKLLSLAQVGLVPENGAQPGMALVALEKLKTEILSIEGKRIKNQYMKRLGIFAIVLAGLVGGVTAAIFWLTHNNLYPMIGYTWFGAMLGAWVSFGARKFELKFEDLSCVEKDMLEPLLRLIYIGVCSLIFVLFLVCGMASITVGSITTEGIRSSIEIQILVGVICGLVESKIGIDIYKTANSALEFQKEEH